MRQGNYRTVQIGKLHFQNHEDEDLSNRPPNQYGFDVFRLSEEPGCYEDAYRKWLRGEHPEYVQTFTVPRPMSPARHEERTNMKVLDAPWQFSHSGWVSTQACRYLYSWNKRPEPQFMHLGFYAPHPPLNPTVEMFQPYQDMALPPLNRDESDWNDPDSFSDEVLLNYKRHFYAMVTGVDMAIGQLLNTLEAQGELDDTLIVFNSDHGDACGDHGRTGKGPSFYEGIMHLPLIMHWPNGLKPSSGRRVSELVEMVDIVPTLLELCDLPVPRAVAGKSWAEPLRSGAPFQGRSDILAIHDDTYAMLQTPIYKYVRQQKGDDYKEILYDLQNDPRELENIATHPENEAILNELRNRLLSRVLNASSSITERRLRF
jgi:arylsulfatase A-like enzyme